MLFIKKKIHVYNDLINQHQHHRAYMSLYYINLELMISLFIVIFIKNKFSAHLFEYTNFAVCVGKLDEKITSAV